MVDFSSIDSGGPRMSSTGIASIKDTAATHSNGHLNGHWNGHLNGHYTPLSSAENMIGVDDWNLLLRAVEDRLRSTVSEKPVPLLPIQARDRAIQVQAVVLDCVAALDKLHQALNQERRVTHRAADTE